MKGFNMYRYTSLLISRIMTLCSKITGTIISVIAHESSPIGYIWPSVGDVLKL
jgi:hypothetical protein